MCARAQISLQRLLVNFDDEESLAFNSFTDPCPESTKMTETAGSHLRKEAKHAVVTVAACLKDPQRQSTKEAGVVEVTPAFEAASRTGSFRGEGWESVVDSHTRFVPCAR